MKYLLSIDQGTTGTRAVIFDSELRLLYSAYKEHKQISIKPGWTEHDPEEIISNIYSLVADVLSQANNDGISLNDVVGIGIANQGETCMAWDSITGKPYGNAIVWHCTRSADIAERLKQIDGFEKEVRTRTGLHVDSYFSAAKILWMRENNPELKRAESEGHVRYGTLDSWMIYALTGGKSYFTDVSTASRTMLFNIHEMKWDDFILDTLKIDKRNLPEVKANCSDFGTAHFEFDGIECDIPIAASIVDQQGALFGQFCFNKGMVKATYGTGCFTLVNTGDTPQYSSKGLVTSVGWMINGQKSYVIDADIYMCGAVMQWLRDKLKIIDSYQDIDVEVAKTEDNAGVYFVTAFSGLSAPVWDPLVKGTIVGMTTSTTSSHIIRAALESVAYQVTDIIKCIEEDIGMNLEYLNVDGGLTNSDFLMQFQSDMLGYPVNLIQTSEATAQGAAMLAGLQSGVFDNLEQLELLRKIKKVYNPNMSCSKREELIKQWKAAEEVAKMWK